MRISDWSSDVCSSDLFEFRPIMRLEAHKPIGEGMVAAVDEQLQAQKFARRLRHLAAAVDQEIIVPPKPRARMVGALETAAARSEERRVGKGCVRTCSFRWSPLH